MAVGKPLHLRLFLEGEEVPVIAAQISINLNAPAAASIQVIPLDEVMNLQPRTMVHLFFLDSRPGNAAGSQYRLLFSGEFVAFSFVQTPQSRGAILQCVDFSNYWDSAHATAIEYGLNGNAFTNHGSLSGGAMGVGDDIVSQQPNLILSWISETPQTPGLSSVTGLAGGIIRMMEAMGGVPGHFKGINDFFTVAELRVRLLSQITAEENDDTSKRLFGGKVFDEWLRNGLQNIGLQVTFRDMMKLLCEYIYYEFVPNPAAKFDPSTEGKTSIKPGRPVRLRYQQQGSKVRKDTLDSVNDIASVLPSGTLSKETIDNISNEILTKCTSSLDSLKTLQSQKPSLGKDIQVVSNAIIAAKSTLQGIISNPKSQLNDLEKAQPVLQKIITAIDDAKTEVASSGTVFTTAKTQRLHTQILRPDCWFTAPPKCNVIFPDMYSQLSFERNFLSETTRVLISTFQTIVGKDELFENRVLAPNIGFGSNSLSKKTNTSDYRLLMDHEIHTGILPKSERISNVSAVSSKVTGDEKKKIQNSRLSWADRISLWHFFRYRFASRQASVGMRFNPFMVCGFPGVIIRSPYIIPGGLKTKLDKKGQSITDDQILNLVDENASILNAPNQLVGMVGGLSHNVDQSGGTTSVSMHHVRRHRGIDDAFIENFITSLNGKTTRAVKTSITLIQARSDPKLMNILAGVTPQTSPSRRVNVVGKQAVPVQAKSSVLSFDPASGKTIETQVVSDHVILQEGNVAGSNSLPPLTTRGRIEKTTREDILVPSPPGGITTGSKNGLYGKQGSSVLGVEVLNPELTIIPGFGQVFAAVNIFENVPITLPGSIPIEEVIRPGWFSNSFSNSNIGKSIYQPFFGCDSVVDELITGGIASAPAVPGSGNDPDVSSFSSDSTLEDVLSSLVEDEHKKNVLSVEKAINILGYIYGQVRSQNVDVEEFIRSYIDRPIATLAEIFGSPDLELRVGANGTATPISGSVGFHTGAVNPVLVNAGNYTGISEDLSLQIQRINNTGQSGSLSPAYDIRKDNKTRVIDYIAALSRGPGFRG